MPDYENNLSYKLFEKDENGLEGPSPREILDMLETSGTIMSSPRIHGNIVFFGSNDHNLYAVSNDGRLMWKFRTGGVILSIPFAYKGSVYFASFDNNFYSLSESDGSLLWKFRTGGRILSSPMIVNDKIYFGSEDGFLYCLATGGDLEWKFRASGEIFSTPIVVNGTVYFGCCDKRLYAVREGAKLWSFLTGGIVGPPVAVNSLGEEVCSLFVAKEQQDMTDGRLCVGSLDNCFYSLTFDGRLDWKFFAGDNFPLSKPATVKKGIVYAGNYDGNLYAITLKDGREIWRFRTGGTIGSTPHAHNGILYVGSYDEHLYAINPDGQMIWKFKTGGPISSSAAIDNNVLYIGSWDTFLYAVSLKGPEILWRFQTGYGYQQTRAKLSESISKFSKLSRALQRMWKPETKPSIYEGVEKMQQNFTFGPAYRMQEPYKSGTEYESGTPYRMERKKKKDWRPF